jgi:hypothetical protein
MGLTIASDWKRDYMTWKASEMAGEFIHTEQQWEEFSELMNTTAQKFLEQLEESV